MTYFPRPVPRADTKELSTWVGEELRNVARSFQESEQTQYTVLHVEPERPRDGMVVVADGADWNPGSGAGVYGRITGSWIKLSGVTVTGTGAPGGLSGNVQFNNAGSFGGLTDAQLTARIGLFTSSLKGTVPPSGGGSVNVLHADGTWGPVGGAPGGSNLQIQYNSSGNFGGYTNTQVTALLDIFTPSLKGVVPPPVTSDTVRFLRADGSWATPPGGGGGGALISGTFTLNAGATSTVVSDAAVTPSTVILWMPTTSNAAAQMATLECGTVGSGSFTLTHANNANVDQTFRYVLSNAVGGGSLVSGTFTLNPSVTSTVVVAVSVTPTSVILWMPVTANAASQMATLECGTIGTGSFTLTHASNANIDQTFKYVVSG